MSKRKAKEGVRGKIVFKLCTNTPALALTPTRHKYHRDDLPVAPSSSTVLVTLVEGNRAPTWMSWHLQSGKGGQLRLNFSRQS
jgi:hypothetical protein